MQSEARAKIDYAKYRSSAKEKARLSDLIAVLPKGRRTVLDIGARDGYVSRLLTEHFEQVTALDLVKPSFEIDRVTPVQGDVTNLQFADASFDTTFCAEVLEHIPPHLLVKACSELCRVARYEVVVGVPYKQELRQYARCAFCGKRNPPWGHVNCFDEQRLKRLFDPLTPISITYIGAGNARTNALSVALMKIAGDPYGKYDQEERCIQCGQSLIRPSGFTLFQRIAAHLATDLNHLQNLITPKRPNWIHMVFAKRTPPSACS
jgi:SAM-dependent methyltransferase